MFHDPRPQIHIIKPPVKKIIFENTDHMIVEVSPGTMLLFPAWLHHSVPRNQGDARKVSVAFNLMFLQFTETVCQPMWKSNIS
jgi:ectoine hydroxylase-related dioxygenase (phytanoyl-CoA dioxygenase family)